jgi:hypothetical protein
LAKRGNDIPAHGVVDARSATRVSDFFREYGSAKRRTTFGRRKYAGLELSKLGELRQLLEDISKLKRLVADLSLHPIAIWS